jgi:hypothetical protein
MSVTNDQIRRMPRQEPTPLARKLMGLIDETEYERLMTQQREREAGARSGARIEAARASASGSGRKSKSPPKP